MVIPEKLLKASDKELDRLLNKDIYKSRFIVNDTQLIEVLNKKHNTVTYLDNNNYNCYRGIKDFMNYFKPLTKSLLKELKTKNILQKLYTSSLDTKIKYLNSVVGRIIDSEHYDITNNNRFIYVVIHYPEITITNSVEQSHLMRDIYVKLSFSYTNSSLIYSRMSMARTTYTIDEYNDKYVFSHLSSCNLGSYYDGFCFGDNTPTVKAINNLNNGSISNLSSFIYLVKEYLSWESLEGSPYKSIDNIPKQSPFNISKDVYSVESVEVDPSTDYILNNLQELNYTYQLRNGNYIVQLDCRTIGIVEELLNSYVPIKYYLIQGESYVPKLVTEVEKSYASEVVFKGVKQQVTVRPIETDLSSYTKSIHRELLDLVVNRIEHKLEEFIFNKTNNYE